MSVPNAMKTIIIDETEPRFQIDKLQSPEQESWQLLWSKRAKIKQYLGTFWANRITKSVQCMEFMSGKIFSNDAIAEYTAMGIVPFQPRIMKPLINSLSGMIYLNKKDGAITLENPKIQSETTARPEIAEAVLKSLWYDMKMESKCRYQLEEALITGFPSWIFFDLEPGITRGRGKLSAVRFPWNSVLPGRFMDNNAEDVEEVILLSAMSLGDIMLNWPNRVQALRKLEELRNTDQLFSSMPENRGVTTAEEWRKLLTESMQSSSTHFEADGLHIIQRHLFFVRKKVAKYMNSVHDVQIIPSTWSEEEKQSWLNEHPDYQFVMDDSQKILWQTTITDSGLILENEQHWFQEEKLPGCAYIPNVLNKMPVGAAEDMIPYIYSIAISETQGNYEVRTGSGTVTYAKQGAIANAYSFYTEMAKPNPLVEISEEKTLDDIKFQQRTPNTAYQENADRIEVKLKDVHNINDAMLGVTYERQSGTAKETELQQGMISQNPYVENWTDARVNLNQLLLEMLPYFMVEEEVVQITGEYGDKEEYLVNEMGVDQNYNTAILSNDLTSARYIYKVAPGDNSITGNEQQLKDFTENLRAIGNTLFQMDPAIAGKVLMSWPNKYAHDAGKYLIELSEKSSESATQAAQAEQEFELEKERIKNDGKLQVAKLPKINAYFDANSIEEAPTGFRVMLPVIQSLLEAPEQQQQEMMVQQQQQQMQGNIPDPNVQPQQGMM